MTFLLCVKIVVILVSTWRFLNYSRGLLGTSGEGGNRNSRYIHELYLGGSAGLGIRISNPESRFAYEIKPLNVQLGNRGFVLGYMMFGLENKIKK